MLTTQVNHITEDSMDGAELKVLLPCVASTN